MTRSRLALFVLSCRTADIDEDDDHDDEWVDEGDLSSDGDDPTHNIDEGSGDDGDGGDDGGADSFDMDAAESAHGCNIATVFCMALFGDQFASTSTDEICTEIDSLYEEQLGDFLPSTPVDTCPSDASGACLLGAGTGQDQALFFYADSIMNGSTSCSQGGGTWVDL
jgi:hypothetical protein